MADKQILLTKEGLKKVKEELKNLKKVKRKEVALRLKEAISFGDLSENSEYEEAKNEQAFVEGRINELEDMLLNVKIIDETHKGKVVEVGSTVVIKDLSDKEDKGREYTIVGSTEADPLSQKMSNESPIGSALLERKVGDEVKVNVPIGIKEFKILKLT